MVDKKFLKYFFVFLSGTLLGFSLYLIGNMVSLEDEYCFGDYKGNWVDSNAEFIDYLNNNPIDEAYSELLRVSTTPTDTYKTISEWVVLYDIEISAAKKTLSEIETSFISDKQLEIGLIDDEFNEYLEVYSSCITHFRENTIGMSSSTPSYVAFSILEKKRNYLFSLAELIYMCTGEFNFAYDGQSGKTGDGSR